VHWNLEPQGFENRGGLECEMHRLGRLDRLLAQIDCRLARFARIAKQYCHRNGARLVIAILDVDLHFTAAHSRNRGRQSLARLDRQWHGVCGLDVHPQGRALRLVRRRIWTPAGLEIKVRPVEPNDERLERAWSEKIRARRQRRNDLLFLGEGPENDALVAGDACGGGMRVAGGIVSRGLSVISRLRGGNRFKAVAVSYAVDQRPDGDQDSRNEYERKPQRGALVFAVGIELLTWRDFQANRDALSASRVHAV